MIDQTRVLDKISRECFADRLAEAISIWISEGKGKYQKDFCAKVGVTPNMISRYLHKGDVPRPEVYQRMIEVLQEAGVTEEFFTDPDRISRYGNSASYIIEKVVEPNRALMKEIGLSENFLAYLWEAADMSSEYPIYSPLVPGSAKYERAKIGSAKDVESEFSIRKDGDTFMLSSIDLRVLKEIQDEVTKQVHLLFSARKVTMEKQLEAANRTKKTFSQNGRKMQTDTLKSYEELCEIDPWMKYCKQERETSSSKPLTIDVETMAGLITKYDEAIRSNQE